jgi:hypothetical protein
MTGALAALDNDSDLFGWALVFLFLFGLVSREIERRFS